MVVGVTPGEILQGVLSVLFLFVCQAPLVDVKLQCTCFPGGEHSNSNSQRDPDNNSGAERKDRTEGAVRGAFQ